MLLLVNNELQVDVIPAGEGARTFANILFRIVANAHREQFHDFASKIFIGRALHIHAGVQERQHCGILRDSDQQIAKVSGPVFFE